jgi:acetate kinase
MAAAILALNAGSSSIKFALYRLAAADALDLAARGAVEGIGTAPRFTASDAAGATLADKRWPDGAPADHPVDHEAILGDLLG